MFGTAHELCIMYVSNGGDRGLAKILILGIMILSFMQAFLCSSRNGTG